MGNWKPGVIAAVHDGHEWSICVWNGERWNCPRYNGSSMFATGDNGFLRELHSVKVLGRDKEIWQEGMKNDYYSKAL